MQIYKMKTFLLSAIFLTAFAACDTDQHSDHHEDADGAMEMMEQDALEDDLREEMNDLNHHGHDSVHQNDEHMMEDGHMMDGDHMHGQGDPG